MDRDTEGVGDAFYIVQRDIARAALDMSDEGAMQTALEGELFLRPAPILAQSNDIGGEDCPCRWFGRAGFGWAL